MALPASYTFTTTENPLSVTYWAAIGDLGALQAANGYARGTATGYATNAMYWSADSPGANQYSQIDVATVSNSVTAPICRVDAANKNFYAYEFNGTGTLRRIDAGSATVLATAIINGTRPLTIKLTCGEGSASTIKAYEAGSQTLAVTDATYASGNFGIYIASGTLENSADNFLADNLTWAGHTLDTNLWFTGTADPLVQAYTCGATATELVLAIVTAGTTSRSGGDPTYNGVALTQRDSTRKYATNPETSCEIWQLDAPAAGAAHNISIPNTGGLTLYAQASSYIAPAGYTSTYDTATGGTGVTANPSVSITPSVDNCVIVAVLGDGLGTAPTGQSGINLNRTDDGAYSDSNMYNLQGTAAPFAARWTVASDDWCMCVLSIKPVAAAIAGFPFLIFKPQNTLLRM